MGIEHIDDTAPGLTKNAGLDMAMAWSKLEELKAKLPPSPQSGRALSLAQTKLDEARMWLGEAVR